MSLQWYPGHMTKAHRELAALMPSQDLVIEVLDARIPASSANPTVRALRGRKPRLAVLTRGDLADPAVTKAWLAYFESASENTGEADAEGGRTLAVAVTSEKPGETRARVAEFARRLGEATGERGKGKALRALIVGVPNVGKSTLLNTLMNKPVAAVSDRPAVTREQQRVTLPSGMVVTDSPGLMSPKIEDEAAALRLAFCGSIPDTAIEYVHIALAGAGHLLARYPALLVARYKLTEVPASPEALLEAIGRKRGFLRVGGVVDTHKAAEVLVHEFRAGQLGRVSLEEPPPR